MAATTAETQVTKKCYKNNTAGWLGVVQLDHLGAQRGISIKPYGTIYLSDDEAILTARAPEDPKNNPFVDQMFQFYDETGKIVEQPMAPLSLVEDERYSPSDERFVPGMPGEVAAGQQDTATKLSEPSGRPVPMTAATDPVPVPSSGAAVPPSHAQPGAPSTDAPALPEEDKRESWTEPPVNRTVEPQPGHLGGSAAPAPGPVQGDPQTTQAGPPPQHPAPQAIVPPTQPIVPSESAGTQTAAGAPSEQAAASVADTRTVLPSDGSTLPPSAPDPTPAVGDVVPAAVSGQQAAPAANPAEETAAVTPSGEETGAAETPVGEAPEGEFAVHEEVGSPDAPTQGASS